MTQHYASILFLLSSYCSVKIIFSGATSFDKSTKNVSITAAQTIGFTSFYKFVQFVKQSILSVRALVINYYLTYASSQGIGGGGGGSDPDFHWIMRHQTMSPN